MGIAHKWLTGPDILLWIPRVEVHFLNVNQDRSTIESSTQPETNLCRLAAKRKDLEDGGEAAEGSDEDGGEVGFERSNVDNMAIYGYIIIYISYMKLDSIILETPMAALYMTT